MSVPGIASPRLLKANLYLASSLYDGVEDNDLRQVTTLLKSKEADPNVLIPMHGITPFHLVIGNDSESFAKEVTKLFLRHGGNPNIKSIDGMTPVHVAAAWGRTRILELLLANGGNPLCLDCDFCTPFNYAYQGKHHDAVRVLHKYCSVNEEKDDGIRYKLQLDKILINNGEVLAEYLVSDNSFHSGSKSASVANSCENYCNSVSSGYVLESSLSKSNFANNDSKINKKNRRKRAAEEKSSRTLKTQEKNQFDFSRNSVQEEIKLLNEIISQLSSSLNSSKNANTNKSPSYRDEYLISCKTNSPKRMQMSMTFNRPAAKPNNYNSDKYRHSQQNLAENNLSKKTLQLIKQHNNIPKLIENWMTTTKKNKKVMTSQPKPQTPIKESLHSNWLDETIISKSPNLHIDITAKERKRNKTSILNFEKRMSPLHIKTNKKPFIAILDKSKDNTLTKLNNRSRTSSNQLTRTNKYVATTTNLKTTVRKNKATLTRTPNPKVYSVNKKGRYQSPLNTTYSLPEFSALSKSSDCKFKNLEERRKSLKDVAVNLSNRMDEQDKEEASSCSVQENLNVEVIKHSENSEYALGVQLLDSGMTSKSSNDSLAIREPTLNETVQDSTSFSKSRSKLSNLDSGSSNCSKYIDPLDSMLVHIGSSSSLTSDSYISAPLANDSFPDNKEHSSINSCEKEIVLIDKSTSSSKKADSETTFLSIEEEYKYEDSEEGVILLERRLRVSPSYSTSSMNSSFYSISTAKSEPLPQELYLLDDKTLRDKLISYGENPGPITKSTYHLYLKRLYKIESGKVKSKNSIREYNINNKPRESFNTETDRENLRSSLMSITWVQRLDEYETLEQKVFQEFSNPHPSRKWREGTCKSSFNYLLLDPRISKDLPRRAASMSLLEKWETFLTSIFYVGKGKQSRPYAHLYEAFKLWISKARSRSSNSKLKRIMDIWDDGQGVVVLQVFQNTIPVEAYTREAAMIEVLGTSKLGNCKSGDYYGVVSTMRSKEKCELGRYMLFKAMQILLLEGERQIFPDNV